MRLALNEMRRKPGRFVIATVILSLISLLLLFLGGLLDGLYNLSTGALRAQKADVVVYSSTARDSLLRSRIDPALRSKIEAVSGVESTGGLGVALLGATVPGKTRLADTAVFGYEVAPSGVPAPPAPGQAWADEVLKGRGVEKGMTIGVGPTKVPVVVAGFVSGTNYSGQGALWVEAGTWRSIQNASRPDAAVADGVFQALMVSGGGDADALVKAIDTATGGATKSLTRDDAVLALPGVKQQKGTFLQIILTTAGIGLVVIALFFSLLTVERLGLYGVLKAIGASSRTLFAGVVVQALVVSTIAFAIGAVIALLANALIPPGSIPFEIIPWRIVFTLVLVLGASMLGSAFSLRRVLRTDPAAAIGGGA